MRRPTEIRPDEESADPGDRRAARAALAAVGLASAVLMLCARRASAQEQEGSLFQRLNLDRLQLSEFGVALGPTSPSQTVSTTLFALHADYGEIAPRWRVVFTTTYWTSRFTDEVVRTFVDSLSKSIDSPSGDVTILPSRIAISDIAVTVDLRWTPVATGPIRAYLGGGFGAHVINAEGRLIDGTFVERALDNITGGVAGTAGLDLTVLNRIILGMQARFDLLSGTRFASLRAGASYRFPGTPGPAAP